MLPAGGDGARRWCHPMRSAGQAGCQRCKAPSAGFITDLPHQPHPHQRVACRWRVPVAVTAPRVERPGVPGAAPAHAHAAFGGPWGVVGWRMRVVGVVVPVGNPFPRIAQHVVQPEGIGRVAAHGRSEGVAVASGQRVLLPAGPERGGVLVEGVGGFQQALRIVAVRVARAVWWGSEPHPGQRDG